MRLVVTGGRTFRDMTVMHFGMCEVARLFGPIELVIHGDATGADKLADVWAAFQKIERLPFPAKWSEIHVAGARVRWGKHGFYNALAGIWRNQEMIDEGKPDVFLAMPGGVGTADMVTRCKAAGLQGIEIK
jgi:hypothetical protein